MVKIISIYWTYNICDNMYILVDIYIYQILGIKYTSYNTLDSVCVHTCVLPVIYTTGRQSSVSLIFCKGELSLSSFAGLQMASPQMLTIRT